MSLKSTLLDQWTISKLRPNQHNFWKFNSSSLRNVSNLIRWRHWLEHLNHWKLCCAFHRHRSFKFMVEFKILYGLSHFIFLNSSVSNVNRNFCFEKSYERKRYRGYIGSSYWSLNVFPNFMYAINCVTPENNNFFECILFRVI